MSTVKISELPVLASADAADEFVVVDDSAGVTKKITQGNLNVLVENADDYEEGTWTPTPSLGSINDADVSYVKIGRLVYVTGRLYDFTDSSASNISVSLPFDAGAAGGRPQMLSAGTRRFDAPANTVSVYASLQGSNMSFVAFVDDNNPVTYQYADLGAFAYVYFSGVYRASS